MLSDNLQYWLDVVDSMQGYPVSRETERIVMARIRLSEMNVEYEENDNEGNPITPEKRWERDVQNVLSKLDSSGAMYCSYKGDYAPVRIAEVIAGELIKAYGFIWASPAHVREAQRKLKRSVKSSNSNDKTESP